MFAIALAVYELQQRILAPVAVELGSTHTTTNAPIMMLDKK